MNDAKDEGKALDALLFANDLMETFKVVPWEGAQYFQQARIIGETYTDLAAFAMACLNVRKTQKATDAYTREISYLSTRLRDNVKEVNCLKQCLDAYTPRCYDRCEGKTRFGSQPPIVQAQSPQEPLTRYVAELQKNPDDTVLREKIIRHAQTMEPAPAIPEEARKSLNRGMAAAEGAMNADDYKDAIAEFQKAVDIAPWLGIGYRNLAVMQDRAGQYPAAVRNLKLFLLTNPPATDTDAAKTLMDKIEYRQEKAARGSSPEALVAKKQKEYDEWLKNIDGRR